MPFGKLRMGCFGGRQNGELIELADMLVDIPCNFLARVCVSALHLNTTYPYLSHI
jgi:hypothetical protein